MLFITNGDSAAVRIEASGLTGEILPWRDVLHEGPIPDGLSLEELSDVRARFLAQRGWTSLAQARRDFARRNATLASYGDHEEVVLFFEHDLYDQVQLIQVLDWFSARDLEGTRLSLVQTDEYLGTIGPGRLRALFRNRRETTVEQGGGRIGDPHTDLVREGLWEQEIVLTTSGREVLSGDRDRVRLIGIERWLGGVHLSGETPWRWDRSTQTLKRDAA